MIWRKERQVPRSSVRLFKRNFQVCFNDCSDGQKARISTGSRRVLSHGTDTKEGDCGGPRESFFTSLLVRIIGHGMLGNNRDMKSFASTSRREVIYMTQQCGHSYGSWHLLADWLE